MVGRVLLENPELVVAGGQGCTPRQMRPFKRNRDPEDDCLCRFSSRRNPPARALQRARDEPDTRFDRYMGPAQAQLCLSPASNA
jgi:hypothetical protein